MAGDVRRLHRGRLLLIGGHRVLLGGRRPVVIGLGSAGDVRIGGGIGGDDRQGTGHGRRFLGRRRRHDCDRLRRCPEHLLEVAFGRRAPPSESAEHFGDDPHRVRLRGRRLPRIRRAAVLAVVVGIFFVVVLRGCAEQARDHRPGVRGRLRIGGVLGRGGILRAIGVGVAGVVDGVERTLVVALAGLLVTRHAVNLLDETGGSPAETGEAAHDPMTLCPRGRYAYTRPAEVITSPAASNDAAAPTGVREAGLRGREPRADRRT